MKKFLLLFTLFALSYASFAASSISSAVPKKATEIFIPLGNNMNISLKDLSVISVKDYQKVTGKKMNFFNKVTFKIGQRNLKNSISEDGTITNKKLSKAFSNSGYGFNAGWFVIGLLGGLIGVLLAYVINGEEDLKKNRQKWAWIGFAAWVAIYVILLASIKVPV